MMAVRGEARSPNKCEGISIEWTGLELLSTSLSKKFQLILIQRRVVSYINQMLSIVMKQRSYFLFLLLGNFALKVYNGDPL